MSKNKVDLTSRLGLGEQKAKEFSDITGKDISEIEIDKLLEFRNHPFKVSQDALMEDLVKSIQENGVLTPILVRKIDETDNYEIISGHRRVEASRQIGLKRIKAIILDLSDDDAIIQMVDSNIQREEILPSERGKAYKMKAEAMNHQGRSTGTGKKTREIIAEEADDSPSNVQRYIRLTYLTDEMLELVDRKKIVLLSAVELSYLNKKSQNVVLKVMDELKRYPNKSQAALIRKAEKEKDFSIRVTEILNSGKNAKTFNIKKKQIRNFFPKDYSDEQIEDVIISLLEKWSNENQTNQ